MKVKCCCGHYEYLEDPVSAWNMDYLQSTVCPDCFFRFLEEHKIEIPSAKTIEEAETWYNLPVLTGNCDILEARAVRAGVISSAMHYSAIIMEKLKHPELTNLSPDVRVKNAFRQKGGIDNFLDAARQITSADFWLDYIKPLIDKGDGPAAAVPIILAAGTAFEIDGLKWRG